METNLTHPEIRQAEATGYGYQSSHVEHVEEPREQFGSYHCATCGRWIEDTFFDPVLSLNGKIICKDDYSEVRHA